MHVQEINDVKEHLDKLKAASIINEWELPYENILTRRSAAIFFVTLTDELNLSVVAQALMPYENFSYRRNEEQKLSSLAYRITFSEEEKQKNEREKLIPQ
jgi:hypothetical protein